MMLQLAAVPDLHVRSDDAVGADVDVLSDPGGRVNDGGRVDRVQSFRFQVPSSGRTVIIKLFGVKRSMAVSDPPR
jgi:hypothetical protein